MKNYALVLAAGKGTRFGGNDVKQFLPLAGKPIFIHAISAFEMHHSIDEIILVVPEGTQEECWHACEKNGIKKVKKVLAGGKSRQESSSIAIGSIGDTNGNVLIHDGVRPLLSQQLISNCLLALSNHGAVTTAIPIT
ncbi:MAG: 2-C-methyl-D-erythritol 4-phosphate cytidylyltransferase, partial [Puniceicoccales bacterium]|nr:2-C-methyl-D-erythritol 4-phosphate cytidylyltransferase [Puniceicoccales bacterium]